jgi:multidrug resistance protein
MASAAPPKPPCASISSNDPQIPLVAESDHTEKLPLRSNGQRSHSNGSSATLQHPDSIHASGDMSQHTPKKRMWRQRVTGFSAIATHNYQGAGTLSSPFLVQWLPNDPEDPKTYTTLAKSLMILLVGTTTFSVTLASSAYTGAFRPLQNHFHSSDEVTILGLSMMVLGFAVGPLLWSPLSEAIGRRHVLIISLINYTIWTAVCVVAPNIQSLIIFRFLCGTFGSASLTVPGGQIADLFEADTRGVASGVFCVTPFLGPTLGPLIGGYISDATSWRWVFGFLALFAAVATVAVVVFVPETYAPVLLRQRAQLLSKVTGKVYLTVMDAQRPLVARDLMRQALVRPWALLFREPIVLILSLYTAVVYGTLYMCFAAFPIVFQQGRGWSAGKGGLAFLGIMLGIFLGAMVMVYDKRRYVRLYKAYGGFVPPEARLPPCIFGGGAMIVGLAWFAATNSPHLHWAIPISAGIPFGLGFLLVFMCCLNYL